MMGFGKCESPAFNYGNFRYLPVRFQGGSYGEKSLAFDSFLAVKPGERVGCPQTNPGPMMNFRVVTVLVNEHSNGKMDPD